MPLTDRDKERVRYGLGYPAVSSPTLLVEQVPVTGGEYLFLLENHMRDLIELAIPRVLEILSVMDDIERQLATCAKRLKATSVSDITLNLAEQDKLELLYGKFQGRLADIFAVVPWKYSQRTMSGGGISIPVDNDV